MCRSGDNLEAVEDVASTRSSKEGLSTWGGDPFSFSRRPSHSFQTQENFSVLNMCPNTFKVDKKSGGCRRHQWLWADSGGYVCRVCGARQ